MRTCALLLAIGCGSDGTLEPDDGLRSGTRIKLQWYDYGGTRTFRGLFDATLGETCTPRTWNDGKTYCTPEAASVVYSDPLCTERAALTSFDPSCGRIPDAPKYALEVANDSARTSTHLYMRGSQLTSTFYFERGPDGACLGPRGTQGVLLHVAGVEVSRSALAEVTREPPATTGRLAHSTYSTADGARTAIEPYDTELAAPCVFHQAGTTGAGECVPAGAFTSLYRDAACSKGAIAVDPLVPTPRFAFTGDPDGCPYVAPRYFPVGDSIPASPLYAYSDGACRFRTGPSGAAYHALGPELSLIRLPRSVAQEPERRVQLIHFAEGAERYRDALLYDVTHGVECYPDTVADGSTRCLPLREFVARLYMDAGCTQPIELARVYRGPASCGPVSVRRFAEKIIPPAAGSCVAGREIYSIGAPYTGPLYEGLGTCVAVQDPRFAYYRLGALHPLGDFPLATLTIDP